MRAKGARCSCHKSRYVGKSRGQRFDGRRIRKCVSSGWVGEGLAVWLVGWLVGGNLEVDGEAPPHVAASR